MGTTFSHDGGIGDIIYHLTAIQQFADVTFCVYPTRQVGPPPMTEELAKSLFTLLDVQPYIVKTMCSVNPIGIDLNGWRGAYQTGVNLVDMFCSWLKVTPPVVTQPWLIVPYPQKIARVVFNRCFRWQNPRFPWNNVVNKYKKEAVFVGFPDEYRSFCDNFGDVPYYPTKDLLSLAQVIAGCELYIGNQSSGASIAESLKKNIVQETLPKYDYYCNCIWERPGREHGFDETVFLPDLELV